MSGHVEESETARKLQLYATSIYQVHSFVCQLDYEADILDFQLKNIGFHLISKIYYFWLSPGDENVIGIRSFKRT